MVRFKIIGLGLVVAMLSGCAFFQGHASDIPFVASEEFEGKHLSAVPLSDNWNEVEVINYSEGYFTFPPPSGYKVLHYADYVNNISLDVYREIIDSESSFLEIIKQRRGGDHCDLYGEKFTTINGIDLIEVSGDCYIWHRGDFKRKYYFVRVWPMVFTFRLLSSPRNFDNNLKEFDNFVDYTVNNYLTYPLGEEEIVPYQHYAYPIPREDLVSFFQPVIEELRKTQ